MNQSNKLWINLTLVDELSLSDKAFFAYVAILMTYRLRERQALTLANMVKSIFGFQANKTEILRQGVNELVQKKAIKISSKEKRTVFYDLTPLANYACSMFVQCDESFFNKFDDLTGHVCSLYRTYMVIKVLINYQKNKEKNNVLKTYKNSLTTLLKCSRPTIKSRLQKLKELGLIEYEDYSDIPLLVARNKPTLFIALDEDKEDLDEFIKKEIPKKYLHSNSNDNKDKSKEYTLSLRDFIDGFSSEDNLGLNSSTEVSSSDETSSNDETSSSVEVNSNTEDGSNGEDGSDVETDSNPEAKGFEKFFPNSYEPETINNHFVRRRPPEPIESVLEAEKKLEQEERDWSDPLKYLLFANELEDNSCAEESYCSSKKDDFIEDETVEEKRDRSSFCWEEEAEREMYEEAEREMYEYYGGDEDEEEEDFLC